MWYIDSMFKTLTYTLNDVFHAHDGGYLGYFPALPGCHTWGDTYEETVENSEEALMGYLESLQKNGEKVPREDQPAANVSLGLVVNLPELLASPALLI
jgi:predicted RNase H-like HicB family nuclease